MKHYPTTYQLSLWFGISGSCVNAVLYGLIPSLEEKLRPEISFPSPQLQELLKHSIPEFPEAIGCMDFTIQDIAIPTADEYRFYRTDKNTHFFNHLAVVDIARFFLSFEPGYSGSMIDSRAFLASKTRLQLENTGAQVLADGIFKSDPLCITPYTGDKEKEKEHKRNRVVIENVFKDLDSFKAGTSTWRHNRSLNAPSNRLIAELHNFRRRKRFQKVFFYH